MIVTTADEVTPEWLTSVLADQLDGAVVTEVGTSLVGTGQMGDSVRLVVSYDRPTSAPATFVAKLPASDPTSRATAGALRNYEIEVGFYRELAASLPMRTPQCHLALHDPDTQDFVLLLEDLAPARQGDQLAGCTVDQAALAVDELPKLHAPRWGDPALESIDWLHRSSDEHRSFTATLVTGLFDGFRERYADRLEPDILGVSERLVARLPAYLASRTGPVTVAHGDYRLDNLLFGTEEGGAPIAVVDWQTVADGPGISDLSYFLGAGLLTEERRAVEADLVRSYAAGLRALGVDDVDDDWVWAEYRRFTFAGLIMAIAASMLVVQTERGDDMFMAMTSRHGRHALDLEAEQLLP